MSLNTVGRLYEKCCSLNSTLPRQKHINYKSSFALVYNIANVPERLMFYHVRILAEHFIVWSNDIGFKILHGG